MPVAEERTSYNVMSKSYFTLLKETKKVDTSHKG